MPDKDPALFGQIEGVFQKGVSQFDEFLYGKTDMKPVRCTDVACLLVFVFYMLGMFIVSCYGFIHGDLSRLNHGYNWKGELCGVHEDVENAPFLYYCKDSSKPELNGIPSALNLLSPICVDECPNNFNRDLMCKDPKSVEDHQTDTSEGAIHSIVITEKVKSQKSYPTTLVLGHYCVPNEDSIPDMRGLYDQVTGTGGPINFNRPMTNMGGLKRVWPLLLLCCLSAVLLGLLFLGLLRNTADFMVYVALVVSIGILIFAGLFFLVGVFLPASNPFFSENNSNGNAALYSLLTGLVLFALGLILAYITYFAKKSIDLAISCIEAATECLFSMPTLFFLPIISTAMKVSVFLISMWIGMYLITSGELETGQQIQINGKDVAGLRRNFVYTDTEKGLIVYFIFGVLWLLETCNAVGQFAASYAVASWYYAPLPKKVVNPVIVMTGLRYGLTYHLGTMVFGAVILAFCRALRLLCEFLAKEAAVKGNKAIECIAKTLSGCIVCIMRFIGFLNKNAYIDVAINSTSFCPAARTAWDLMSRNAVTIALLNGACYIFSVAGTLLITLTTTFLAHKLITSQERWTSETSPQHVSSPLFVSIVIALISGFISHSFMMVFDNTADVLLYLFCWNREHGHNSVARYASTTLQKLLKYEKIQDDNAFEDEPTSQQVQGEEAYLCGLSGRGGTSETKPLMGRE